MYEQIGAFLLIDHRFPWMYEQIGAFLLMDGRGKGKEARMTAMNAQPYLMASITSAGARPAARSARIRSSTGAA